MKIGNGAWNDQGNIPVLVLRRKVVKKIASEKNFEDRIKAFLKDQGCWFVKYWAGNSSTGKNFTKEGIPDILCCCQGRFIGIEVKAPNGRPKPLQLWNLKQIDNSGGCGVLLYPDMWDDFKEFMRHPTNYDNWYLSNIKYQEEWKNRLERK